MRRKFLLWFYTKIERLLTKGFRHFRNLAFTAARSESIIDLQLNNSQLQTDFGGDVGIVITTFEPRFQIYAVPLIVSLRKTISSPIYLVINGNFNGPANAVALSRLIGQLSEYENVFPIVFGQMQGCASLWNTGLKHSNCSTNFVFNDDIAVDENTIATQMQVAVETMSSNELVTINNSWSHYLISNRCLSSIGLFDERFLGFGWEDGDYIERVKIKTGKDPANILLPSFVNIIDQNRDTSIAASWGKYSLFNNCLYLLKYPESQSTTNFFDKPGVNSIPEDYNLESLQKFKMELYDLLVSESPEEVINSILNFYASKR